MVQLPNGMPTHGNNEVPVHMARSHLEMGLNSQEVIGDIAWNIGWHGMRQKLEEILFLVSHPLQQPTIIGGTQVLIGTHGPPTATVKAPI